MTEFSEPSRAKLKRTAWRLLGLVYVGLGIIGAIVPLMPTTIFLILAAGCFARSSPQLEAKLLSHSQFGPAILVWRTEGAIPRRGKQAACLGIAVGYLLFWIGTRPSLGTALAVAVAMAACALWIVSRPSPRSHAGQDEPDR